jgi:DNA-binding SARP family transcriptional activator
MAFPAHRDALADDADVDEPSTRGCIPERCCHPGLAATSWHAAGRSERPHLHHRTCRGLIEARMDFLILGPMEVFDGATRRLVSGSTLRTLLAVFLLNANVVVPVDRLIDLLWGQEAPDTARHALHVHISRLRHALFDPNRTDVGLERQAPGYILHVDPGRIDASRFERSVHLGHDISGRDPRAATAAFDEALGLWRGPLLMDLGDVGFAITARERLDEMRLDAVEERFACQLAMGRDADLVGDLRAHIAAHRLA